MGASACELYTRVSGSRHAHVSCPSNSTTRWPLQLPHWPCQCRFKAERCAAVLSKSEVCLLESSRQSTAPSQQPSALYCTVTRRKLLCLDAQCGCSLARTTQVTTLPYMKANRNSTPQTVALTRLQAANASDANCAGVAGAMCYCSCLISLLSVARCTAGAPAPRWHSLTGVLRQCTQSQGHNAAGLTPSLAHTAKGTGCHGKAPGALETKVEIALKLK